MDADIRLLHVDDEPDFAALTASYLERADERFTVETATSAADGLDRLSDRIDCIISDYEMPGRDGIEFLTTVRAEYPDLPFILFTGRGSEEIASEAISAGVTDYLQKESGTEQYAVLANRIKNAVAQSRAEQNLQAERQRFQALFERLTQPTVEIEYEDGDPIVQTVNPAFEDVFGYDESELAGEPLDQYILPDREQDEAVRIGQRVETGGPLDSVEVTRCAADGQREFLFQYAGYEDGSGGFAIYTDITERKRQEQRLRTHREQLENLLAATRDLLTVDSRDAIAARASETAHDVLNLPLNGIYLYDSDLDALVPVAVSDPTEEVFDGVPVIGRGEGVAWTAYETGEVQVYGDIRDAPEVLNPDTPIRSECHIPIGEHGVLITASSTVDDFTDTDVTFAKLLAAQLETAFDRAANTRQQQAYAASLRSLHRATETLMAASDRDAVASRAVATARAVLDQPINGIWFYDEATDALEPAALSDQAREVVESPPVYTGSGSLSWRVFEAGEMRVCNDLRNEPDLYNPATPIASELVIPLGEYGVMNIGATEPDAFDDIDTSLARVFRDIVETALSQAEREQELTRNREFLRRTEELAGTGGWEVDTDAKTQRWTQGTYAIHDVSSPSEFEPASGEPIEFYHPDDRATIRQALEDCLEAGTSFTEELRLITAADRERWVRTTGEAVSDDGAISAVRGAVQDITEHKRQQQELEQKNERLSALFEQFPEPTVAYAHRNGEPYIENVNEAFTEVFGYDEAEACGTQIDELIVPPARQPQATRIDEQVQAGEPVNEHVRRQTDSGLRDFRFKNIPLSDDDAIDGYGVYADITERKERERTLQERNTWLQALFEQAPDPIFVHDLSGAFTDVNQTATEVLSYSREELLSMEVADIEQGPSGKDLARLWEETEVGAHERVEGVHQRADGSTFPVEVWLTPVELEGTKQFIAIARDITDRETRVRELKRKNERLEDFASILSHDLQNPLTVAEGRLELARADCESPHLSEIATAHDRMRQLIEKLLTLAQHGETVHETEPVALETVVESGWNNVEAASATVENEAGRTIAADRSRLQEVIENLLRNAIDHGGEDVTVRVGDMADPAGFYVADDGPGIPPADRQQVFDRGFSTTDDGTGFGLAIVKEIVEAHGWEITVTDSVDGGARFEITGVESPR